MPRSKHHIGRYINHDDTVGTGYLASGLDQTKEAWQQTYNEDYLNPYGLTFQNANNAPREPSTADKPPPPILTLTQRALSDFDVSQQITHEDLDFRLLQLNEEVARANQQLATLPQTPVPSQSGGFMKRLLKAAIADDQPHPSISGSRTRAIIQICEAQRFCRPVIDGPRGHGPGTTATDRLCSLASM